MVVTPHTELVVDGYTRSATTYAVYAFQLAQTKPVRMAHHLHAPAQIAAAARWGVPTILLVRDPEGAVLSQVVREPGVTVRDALVSWRRFYQSGAACRDAYVVGEFGRVTTDMGGVIRDVNRRFGTSFEEFERTEEHERQVLDLMGERPTTIAEWSSTLLGFESGFVSREEVLAEYQRFRRTERPRCATDLDPFGGTRLGERAAPGASGLIPCWIGERARAYRDLRRSDGALAAFPSLIRGAATVPPWHPSVRSPILAVANIASTWCCGRSWPSRSHPRSCWSFVEPPGAGLGHGIDKVQHALAYFVTMLAALLAAVWRPGRGPGRFPGARWLIAAGALACGAMIEILQSVSTTNRQGDVGDWLAEVVGVGLAVLAQRVLEQRSSARSTSA